MYWKTIRFCLAASQQRGLAVRSRLDCSYVCLQLEPHPFLLLLLPLHPRWWLGSELIQAPWLCCLSSLLCRLWPYHQPSCWPCSSPQPAWPWLPQPRAFLVWLVHIAALQPGQLFCRSPADLRTQTPQIVVTNTRLISAWYSQQIYFMVLNSRNAGGRFIKEIS